MERLAPQLRGKLVLWLVCLGNDLDDALHPGLHHYRAPFVRQRPGSGEWEIATDHVDPSRWTITDREGSLDSLIEICSSGYTSQRAFAVADYLVGRAREACSSVSARLVVMTIPELSPVARRYLERAQPGDRFDEDLPDRQFTEICDRHAVRFVPLRDHLTTEDYLDNDFHWNARGHRRVAQLVDQLYGEASWREIKPTAEPRDLATEAAG